MIQTQTQTRKPAPSRQRRMTLASVAGATVKPTERWLIYGPPGVGKTSLAADAPRAVFIPVERGVDHLPSVARFPQPETLGDVLDAIDELTKGEHDYQTVVIDTLTELEKLVHAAMIQGTPAATIEEWGGGYNKWRQGAVDTIRPVLLALDRLQAARGMDVIIVCHSAVKAAKDPTVTEPYDRNVLLAEEKLAGYVMGWSTACLFYRHETVVTKSRRGTATGRRLLHTEHAGGYDAKNRMGLPPIIEVPAEHPWATLAHYMTAPPDAELEALFAELPGDVAARARAAVVAAKGEPATLARILNHTRALVAQQQATTEETT